MMITCSLKVVSSNLGVIDCTCDHDWS